MAERWLPSDGELAQALAALGREIVYPPTPMLAQAVRARIAAGRPSWRQRLESFWASLQPPQRAVALAGLALVLLATSILSLFPDARTTVAHWLGLRGINITTEPSSLPSPFATLPAGPVGERLKLGDRVTLSDAQGQVKFHILVPTRFDLSDPDEVYFLAPPAGGEVSLVYLPGPGVPQATTTGVGLLITEFRGDLDPGMFQKSIGPATRLTEVTVRGVRGYWIEGQPHFFFYRDASGSFTQETLRLAANTLIWEQQDGLTVRIESVLSKDQVLRIAESMR